MLNFDKFRTLTFDCYGTIIDWESGILSALRPILQRHSKPVDDARLLELYGELELKAENPYQSYRKVLQAVVNDLGQRLGFAATAEEATSLPDSLPKWKPWPDSVAALRKLKAKYKLVVISNVDDDLFATTAKHLDVAFDHVITAQQAKCYKPCRQIFELALSRIASPREEVLHVGQSVYHDVVPAKALGLSSVWVNRPSARPGVGAVKAASGKPDLEVSNLASLAKAAGL
jgi:2-haloacid dehalogenase